MRNTTATGNSWEGIADVAVVSCSDYMLTGMFDHVLFACLAAAREGSEFRESRQPFSISLVAMDTTNVHIANNDNKSRLFIILRIVILHFQKDAEPLNSDAR